MTAPSITSSDTSTQRPVLYLVGCAAPPVHHIHRGIELAQDRGFDTCLILTPTAAGWLETEIPALEKLTGHPVRSTYKRPGAKDVLPSPDAFLVAPATLNTTTRWADGHQDNLALGLISEALGRRLFDVTAGENPKPIVAMPYLNAWQAAHPAFARAIETLRQAGVDYLVGDDGFNPHIPHTGQGRPEEFPWQTALAVLPADQRLA